MTVGTSNASEYMRLKQAFQALSELAPVARAARLAELERGSPTLALKLRQQLASVDKALPLLDRISARSNVPVLDRYTILRELGRGGMGVVWLAERDLGGVKQTVAIKQVAGLSLDGNDPRRFERERRILASLEHPNIAALLDGGADSEGRAFLATQFVDGQRLDHWCREHAPNARSRVLLLRDMASAIAYAHRNLVVHRDLKPANILVTADGQAKLLDFGIARVLDDDPLTSDGQSQMTLRYAAPEQVAGEGGESGVGVDIYALGVLMYELLAQTPMYADASGSAALIHAILHETPVAPSGTATPIAGTDADLDAICLRALRKRPADRYSDARAMLADLNRWLERAPVEARRGETGYQLRRFVRRRWAWLAAAVVLVAGVVYHLDAQRRQLVEVQKQRDRAQALATHFSDLFEEASPAETEAGDVSAVTLLERSVARLENDDGRSPMTRATLLIASANAMGFLGRAEEAKEIAQAALNLAMSIEPRDPALLASAHGEVASSLDRTGDTKAALAEAEAGLSVVNSAGAVSDEIRRVLMLKAAMYAEALGDKARARAGYQQIVDLTRQHLDDRQSLENYLAAQVNLATSALVSNPRETSDRLQVALDIAAQHGFRDQATLLPMRMYLGNALYSQRRMRESRLMLEPLLADARAFYGSEDVWRALMLSIVGNLYVLDCEPERGDALLTESHAILLATSGPESPQTRAVEADRAIASVMSKDWPEAMQRIDTILAWMVANGRGEKRMAQYLRIARAYVIAQVDPTPSHLTALIDAAKVNVSWASNDRWTSDEWANWARSRSAKLESP